MRQRAPSRLDKVPTTVKYMSMRPKHGRQGVERVILSTAM